MSSWFGKRKKVGGSKKTSTTSFGRFLRRLRNKSKAIRDKKSMPPSNLTPDLPPPPIVPQEDPWGRPMTPEREQTQNTFAMYQESQRNRGVPAGPPPGTTYNTWDAVQGPEGSTSSPIDLNEMTDEERMAYFKAKYGTGR